MEAIEKTTKLNNFEIKKLTDRWSKEYFLIVNNDNQDEVYFCFQTKVKEGWDILESNPTPSNIEIEYEESEQNGRTYKRVIRLYTDDGILI